MQSYRFRPLDSIFLNSPSQYAVLIGAADPGNIFVLDQRAYIHSLQYNAVQLSALDLNSTWKVTINGSIYSTLVALAVQGVNSRTTVGATGDVIGDEAVAVAGDLTNFGTIVGGTIGARVALFSGNTALVNSGTIQGGNVGVSIEGLTTLTNKGTIGGLQAINATTSDIAHIKNSGKLFGDVDLGGAGDFFTNYIKTGHVTKNGKVAGIIDLGLGDDNFKGGANAEVVRDSGGSDTYKLGGGNDVYYAFRSAGIDGTDTVDGGAGIDTYVMSDAPASVQIYLGIGGAHHDLDGSNDIITGFENAVGGASFDQLFGSNGVNKLSGGADNDTLVGGRGADILTGGPGLDSFQYLLFGDSGVSAKTRDTITDFTHGDDAIGLNNLTPYLGGSLTFIGPNGFNHDGTPKLRYSITASDNTLVLLDADGNGKADFSILLLGHHELVQSDFYY